MEEEQGQLLTAVRDLTEQLEKLNTFLMYGAAMQTSDPNEIRAALRAIASGEEPCVFMAEGGKIHEA